MNEVRQFYTAALAYSGPKKYLSFLQCILYKASFSVAIRNRPLMNIIAGSISFYLYNAFICYIKHIRSQDWFWVRKATAIVQTAKKGYKLHPIRFAYHDLMWRKSHNIAAMLCNSHDITVLCSDVM